MTKIVLIGIDGKMGRTIVNLVGNKDSKYKIIAGVDKIEATKNHINTYNDITKITEEFDVIIDFSTPDSLDTLLSYCKKNNKPIVLCTTGYTKKQLEIIENASMEIAIFKSANMSLGINVINNLLKKVSNFLYKDFDIEIIEKHHNEKVDAPSGTALLLADTIKDSIDEEIKYIYGREGNSKRDKKELALHTIRGGGIVGDHEVIFAGTGEVITLSHNALSRDVFAIGALKASTFIKDKKTGLYNMDNLILDSIL